MVVDAQFTSERFHLEDIRSRHSFSCELIRYREVIEAGRDKMTDCDSIIEMLLPHGVVDTQTSNYFNIFCRHFLEVDLSPGAESSHPQPTINMLQRRTSGVRKPKLPDVPGNSDFQRALVEDLEKQQENVLADAKELGTYDQAKQMLDVYRRLISGPSKFIPVISRHLGRSSIAY